MTEEVMEEVVQVPPPPPTRKPRKPKPEVPQEKSAYVQVINVGRTDVTYTGRDGNLYRVHPRDKTECLRVEAEKSPNLEIIE